MIRTNCPQCSQEIKADDSLAGRKGRCPRCGQEVTLPWSDNDPLLRPSAGVDRKMPEELIDMTAMVDVVFFILIFFMVTSFSARQAAVDMPRTRVTESARAAANAVSSLEDFEEDDDYFVVRIDADGSIWLDGSEVAGIPDLAHRLREESRSAAAATRLLLVAEGDAPHGTAVEVLDTAREVGLEELRISVVEEE